MAYKVLIVDDQVMPRQLFESFVGSSSRYELVASVERLQWSGSCRAN